jgi:hypothetical protein
MLILSEAKDLLFATRMVKTKGKADPSLRSG